MNISAQHASGLENPVRSQPPRPADGRGRHRRGDRDLQAQRAVSARRPSRQFLRLHGCHRRHPLSAGVRLSQGRAGKGRLYRPPPGEIPARSQADVDAGDADQHRRLGRRHAEGGRLHPQGRPEDQTHRRRIRISSLRCLDRAARRVSRRRLGRCAVRAGAPAREKIRRRTGEAESRLGSGARVDAGGDRQSRPGHDQGRGGRGAAPRGNQSRADLRILPDHLRHQHEPRALRPEMGEGRHHVDRHRRQLSRLYRRHLPHGDPGRAGRRVATICWPRSKASSARQ